MVNHSSHASRIYADLGSTLGLLRSKWKQFYINAILESEVARLPHRIVEAENAIATRAKELLQESAVNRWSTA